MLNISPYIIKVKVAALTSRILLQLGPLVRFLHLSRLWVIPQKLLTNGQEFTKSVYGPWLQTDWADHQFYLCATGKSGFKLSDILTKKRSRPYVFVDVGANVGLYSLIAASSVHCKQAYAIEPNQLVYKQLQANTAHNSAEKVCSLNLGVAETNGKKKFFYKDWHRGLGNFLSKGDYSIDVHVRDSSLFDDISVENPEASFFLKIDVEGFEPQVVRELAKSKMAGFVDELFIEVSPKWTDKALLVELFELIALIGLKEIWRSSGNDQYDAYFVRPTLYRQEILQEKVYALGENQTSLKPKYSVCVCNYNMADTLMVAMSSVLEQLDELYEVLVIDDGSSDNSIEILEALTSKHRNFRYISLARDRNRYLGETRNISIRAARGDYVLLHIDADDKWEPYLKDFVQLFHNLEVTLRRDILLVGQQTGMARRDFLLRFGPYENIYRCEDRNMMFKLASKNAIYFMDYKVYRTRLARPKSKQLIKTIHDTWSHMTYDLRVNEPRARYISEALFAPFSKSQFSLEYSILRSLLVIPVWIYCKFKEKIVCEMTWDQFSEYHKEHRGTYSELMKIAGGNPTVDFLGAKAREIYSYRNSGAGFKSD